jgi:hypothetical protein
MNTPGFAADALLNQTKNPYYKAITFGIHEVLSSEGKVLPQQECFTFSGKCTGFWPWYQGTQCVTGFSGTQQCCTNASTYPAIRECRNPDGTWSVVNH